MTAVREHGTLAGYDQHIRRGETPCDLCRGANNRYKTQWREQHTDAAARSRASARARHRALARLAAEYPERFAVLLAEASAEVEREGR